MVRADSTSNSAVAACLTAGQDADRNAAAGGGNLLPPAEHPMSGPEAEQS